MEYVFIDTSVFEANNFIESNRIKQLLKLSEEGEIRILLPILTYEELKNRAAYHVQESIGKFKNSREDYRILRNIPSLQEKFSPRHKKDDVIKEFFKEFDNSLKKANCISVNYPERNISSVFESYFKKNYPFGTGDKKREFPDAFALLSIENYCEENRIRCTVLTTDKDILGYKSKFLKIPNSYEEYLENKLRKIEERKHRANRIDNAIKLFENKKKQLENEVKEWLLYQLDNEHLYRKYTDMNIHDIDINEYDVEFGEPQIVSINEDTVEIEIGTELNYNVELEIDEEGSGWYDDEARIWHYIDTEYKEIDDSQSILVTLKVEIPAAGKQFTDIEIDEINFGQDLHISRRL